MFDIILNISQSFPSELVMTLKKIRGMSGVTKSIWQFGNLNRANGGGMKASGSISQKRHIHPPHQHILFTALCEIIWDKVFMSTEKNN